MTPPPASLILIGNLSMLPPPEPCPSVAVSRKVYPLTPLTVPVPLYCALAPETTSQSYDVLLKLNLATWNWNSVLPVGTLAPFRYFETNPKVALPHMLVS